MMFGQGEPVVICLAASTYHHPVQFVEMCIATPVRAACPSLTHTVEYKKQTTTANLDPFIVIFLSHQTLHRLLLRSQRSVFLDVVSVFCDSQDAQFLFIVFLCVWAKQLVFVVCFSHQRDN